MIRILVTKKLTYLPLVLIITLILITVFCPILGSLEEENGITHLTITFKMPQILEAPIKGYVLIKVPGTRPHLVPGAPIVPVKVVTLKLPYDSIIKNIDVDTDTMEINGRYVLLPAPKPKPLQPPRTSEYIENPEIYRSREPYPEKNVEYEVKRGIDPITLTRVVYLVIRIFPVQFIPQEKRILYTRRVDIDVEYEIPKNGRYPTQTIDLIVITSEELKPAATDLAHWKNSTGFKAKVYTVEWITSNYPGKDPPEKIRNFINYTVNNYGTTFVIILGDADVVPVRWVYFSQLFFSPRNPNNLTETDLYYADLDGTWDTDNDGYYGEIEDDIDGYPDVIIGRLPASNLIEAYAIVNKLLNYTPYNEWFRRILLLGTITFENELYPEGEIIKDFIETYNLSADFYWKKLYEGLNNLTPDLVKAEMNRSYGFVNFAGHGGENVWSFGEGGVFTTNDVYSLMNGYNTSIIATMACLTGDYGDTDICIGEAFLLHNGGGIAYLGATEIAVAYTGYWITYGLAGEVDWRFLAAFKEIESQGSIPTPGTMHVLTIIEYLSAHGRSYLYDWFTIVEYGTLLGDPSLALTGIGDPPPPPPIPKLCGYILDDRGRLIQNASVELYDYDTGAHLYSYNALNGYYEFVNISYGTYRMEIRAEGYTNKSIDLYYPRVVLEVNVTLHSPPKFPPNTTLIVVDDDGECYVDRGVWPDEIKSVIESLGFNVYVWNESELGRPSLKVLLDENVTAVVWHVGTYWKYAVDELDAQTLIEFIENGGRLLLEGEDIGLEHQDDDFMRKVAHAIFSIDDTNASGIRATAKHPVIFNLSKILFEVQPPFPDGVKPVNGGIEVAQYIDINYSAIIVYDGLYRGSGGRVIYVAFPLHYLASTDRNTLIENSIRWLTTSYILKVHTDKHTYTLGSRVKIIASLMNGSKPLTGIPVAVDIYYPNGTLAKRLQMVDDGSNGDDTAGDGNYTALYEIPATAPSGQYNVEVCADIPSYTTIYEETIFEVERLQTAFTITVEDVDITEGKVSLNLTISSNVGLIITMVQYCVDCESLVNITNPIDGAYDESTESVHIELNTDLYSTGEHTLYVKAHAEGGFESDWITYKLMIRELQARYNLISLTLKPLKQLKASDLARAIGSSLKGVWRWRTDKQEFEGYVPGVSDPEEDFPIEPGHGYFVYLSNSARMVEVGL